MASTLRTIGFLVSTVILFLLYPFIYHPLHGVFHELLRESVPYSIINEIAAGSNLLLSLILLGTLQGLLKFFFLLRHRKGSPVVMSLPIRSFSIADQIIYYIVPLIIYILPLFLRPHVNEIIAIKVGVFVITIIALRLWLQLSKKSTPCYFLKEGLLITGFDVRLDLPIHPLLENSSGFYPYEKLSEYQLTDQRLTFKLPFDAYSLVLDCKDADINEINEFLQLMKVPGEIQQ